MIFFIDENQDDPNKLENNKNDKNSLDNSNSHIDERSKDRSQNDNQLDDYKYENYSNRKLDSNVDDTNSNSKEQDRNNNENLIEKMVKIKTKKATIKKKKLLMNLILIKEVFIYKINLICRILKLYKKMI